MMFSSSTRSQTLVLLVISRIVLCAAIAAVLQAGLIFCEYWFDDDLLGYLLIGEEVAALDDGLSSSGSAVSFALPAKLATRYRQHPGSDGRMEPGYYLRIRTAGGRVIYSNCDESCTHRFLPLTINPPGFWQREIEPGKPLSVIGGRSVTTGGQTCLVELAVFKDPDGVIWDVVADELSDHLLIPTTVMLALILASTAVSVRRALAPVRAAAEAANSLDPRFATSRLPTEGMPLEIADLTQAVNRAFGRVGELMRSQKLFSAAISHEIRTPVAIAKLEIARIVHPRARKAEADLDKLTHFLEKITSIARLEAVDRTAFAQIELGELAEDIVAATAPLVFDSGRKITFCCEAPAPIAAIPALIETLLRNLIENAIRHTPAGTSITVAAGPGPRLVICDDGPGLRHMPDLADPESGSFNIDGGMGLGLRIVRRIAELHDARMTLGGNPDPAFPGKPGTRLEVLFPAAG